MSQRMADVKHVEAGDGTMDAVDSADVPFVLTGRNRLDDDASGRRHIQYILENKLQGFCMAEESQCLFERWAGLLALPADFKLRRSWSVCRPRILPAPVSRALACGENEHIPCENDNDEPETRTSRRTGVRHCPRRPSCPL